MTQDAPDQPYDRELMAAVTELGAAMRGLVETTVTTTVGAGELRAVAEQVRTATAHLAASTRPLSQLPPLDDPGVFRRVYNPVSGIGSPIAPPLAIRRSGEGVVAEVELGAAYEGPPSYVHGGMSSLLMDQLLGAAAMAAGNWGMTARLELDYRGPVPLTTPLVLRAGVSEDPRRKTVITGTIALAAEPERTLVAARGISSRPGRS